MTVFRILPISIGLHAIVVAAVLTAKPHAIELGRAEPIELALVGEASGNGFAIGDDTSAGRDGQEHGIAHESTKLPRAATRRPRSHPLAKIGFIASAQPSRRVANRDASPFPDENEAPEGIRGTAKTNADNHAGAITMDRDSEGGDAGALGGGTATGHGSKSGLDGGLGKGDVGLQKISGDRPRYPVLARRQGVEGKVAVRLVVRRDGVVEDAKVLSASPAGLFDRAAIDAIRTWRFAPLRSENVTADIDVKFTIDQASAQTEGP